MHAMRQGSPAEGPLQASKWLSSQVLIDGDEMASLFEAIGPVLLYNCGIVNKQGEALINKDIFLKHYRQYIDELKSGVSPHASSFRPLFSLAMTTTTDSLFSIPLADGKEIVRIAKPIIQMQIHYLSYSTVDKKFHPMVFGLDSIAWGIQFSYPQLYQDSHTKMVENVKDTPEFPNTKVFQLLQKWIRNETIPTPFLAEEIATNVPMRLGKKCTSWINTHPDLIKKGISVRC